MASGKSLELKEIQATASWLCLCGARWSDHLRKDGKPLKKYANDKHRPMAGQGYNRQQRRAMRHGR